MFYFGWPNGLFLVVLDRLTLDPVVWGRAERRPSDNKDIVIHPFSSATLTNERAVRLDLVSSS